MINRQHTKHYERNIRYIKVEYSTATGVYSSTHDDKVHFSMLQFSSSKIINHWFHVDNEKLKSGIGYDMIIVHDLKLQLGITESLKS